MLPFLKQIYILILNLIQLLDMLLFSGYSMGIDGD